tara:strand:+ start:1735 stop:2334 length:600 start_codon:yes stop_codon:yes gene_type:complete
MLQVQIIEELNNFLQNYLNLKFKPLSSRELNIFRIQGNSEAINHRRNDSEKIKVLPWFDDFFIYVEIRFVNDYTHKLISLSIFQGSINDIKKNQLFRAEWDDYNIDNESRPQPHWHITRDNAVYDKFSDLTNHSDEKEKVGFEFYEEVLTEVFDTKQIHFAMSGNWQNQESPVHKIDDAIKVVKWIEGLLEHIKYELQN